MAVIIKIGKTRATILNGEWKSRDPDFKDMLAGIYTEEDIMDYTPWPDYTLAEMAVADALDAGVEAEVIEATGAPEYVEGRIY